MSNKNLEELQIEHFKRTVAESDREKAKEKRRLETMVQKLKDLISLTSSLDLKVKKLFLYLGIGLMGVGIIFVIIMFAIFNQGSGTTSMVLFSVFGIIALGSGITGFILLNIYLKNKLKKFKKNIDIAKEATNIGKQVINTLKAYQFADEENMEGTIANIESRFLINVGQNNKQLRIFGNSIINELIILNKQAKTMLERVNDDLVEI
ncbi:hypothetical protein [Mycoplasmopsis gallinarum]|uniref:hypothetical protein n=1 Tax=Mycoplasmopsis gallinarum TaxID=29557 RepID=UPI000489D667|nr:hypothetical protein [Mycoplasmopsis gallinarum]